MHNSSLRRESEISAQTCKNEGVKAKITTLIMINKYFGMRTSSLARDMPSA